MSKPSFEWRSSVGKKLLNGLTGLLAMGFLVSHLLGNLTLLAGPEAFNGYSERLRHLGPLLTAAELGLLALFVVHAVSAIRVYLDKRSARSVGYTLSRSKGAPSRQGLSSRSMIVTGLVLLAFLVWHVIQFRFGPSYPLGLGGEEGGRDLYRLVYEVFQNPFWVAVYVGCMALLGLHLRHGFWSAFQSLGALDRRLLPTAYAAGAVFAVVLAVGFLILPVYMMLFAPEPLATGLAMVP